MKNSLSHPTLCLSPQVKALEEAIREETAAGQTPDAATQEALQQVWRWLNFPVAGQRIASLNASP